MPIELNFPSKSGGINKDSCIVVDIRTDNARKYAEIILSVWSSEENMNNLKSKINETIIVASGDKDVIRKDGTLKSFSYTDIAWKGLKDVYKKLKKIKLRIDGEVVDLSEFKDI